MSQLPPSAECPVDWTIIKICSDIAPIFHATGHTANAITTEGAIASGIGLYSLYNYNLPRFAVGYALGYAFDCLDGHYARRYKMTSKFGEIYEHMKDILTTAAYFGVLFYRYELSPIVITLYCIFGAGLLVHMGHQQKFIKSKGTFLDFLQPLARKVKNIKYTRWLGCGTFMVFSVVTPFFLRKLF